jgi:hypothetical protein
MWYDHAKISNEARRSLEIVLAALAVYFDNNLPFLIIAIMEGEYFISLPSPLSIRRQRIQAIALVAFFFVLMWGSCRRERNNHLINYSETERSPANK